MKTVIIIALFILHTDVFAQAKNEGDKFLGSWYPWGVARKKSISDCVMRRRGNEYTLQYVKFVRNAPQIQAFFYKLKGDSLVGEDKSYGNIIFIPKTGHIKWKEGEWGKSTTNQIEGAPLDKK